MTEPRGAGRGGGLLFVGVLAFVAYLAATQLTGPAAVAIAAITAAGALLLLARVLRRR